MLHPTVDATRFEALESLVRDLVRDREDREHEAASLKDEVASLKATASAPALRVGELEILGGCDHRDFLLVWLYKYDDDSGLCIEMD